MEEEVGLVDEAHAGSFLSGCKYLPADVKWTHFHIFASLGSVRLALVVRHHLVGGRPHAQVVHHLRTAARGETKGGERRRNICAMARSRGFRFYLSHILIGGQNNFIKSRRPDVDPLLESDGHHGCLKREIKVTSKVLLAGQQSGVNMRAAPSHWSGAVPHEPLSVPLVVSGSAGRSSSSPATGSSCGCDRCTCR